MKVFSFERKGEVVVALMLLVVFWGSSFAVVKLGLQSSPPVLFAGLRALVGGLAMLGVALVWGGKPNLRREWRAFSTLTLANVAIFIGLQTYTIMTLPSGMAAIMVYLQPIFVGFLAWLVLDEALTAAKVVGLLLGFSGIVAVSAGGLSGSSGEISAVGIPLGAAAALSWAFGTVYFKRVQDRVSALWSVAIPFVAGGAILTLVGAATESLRRIEWSGSFIAVLLAAGLVGISAAWLIFFGLVKAGEASRVSAYIFAVPLSAVAIGVVFLGEPLRASLLIGAALVVGGIYLVNRSSSSL